ncbi:hypothetical protein OG439_32620 [Amycolatopsis sp. NBC_01307]|uniref:hypothetical protein n=1 Tax=Amycolatopsis sp. NBC_01307 TaxID=2903561 RepID=UPI002E10F412|nr:hypothetical protein OG439_32620 [Amycolatopsis sp. NBC_01307]
MAGTTYHATAITAWLTDTAGLDPDAARRAGRAVAEAWNACEFYASATCLPLAAALTASGRPAAGVDAVAQALARRFGTHLHDVPAWDRNPLWRKEIA